MKIAAIIVTCNPNLETLRKLLDAVSPQVDTIIIVDNNSSSDTNPVLLSCVHAPDIHLVQLNKNRGIAYAQNTGIEKAGQLAMSHVLLLDQDSLPADDMVKKLTEHLKPSSSEMGGEIAAVGPVRVDVRNGTKSFFMTETNGYPKLLKKASSSMLPVEAAYLISSGALIPLSVIETVGGMQTEYFIDRVDTEWSFRVRAKGYRLLGIPDAVLYHALGDKGMYVWFLGQHNIPWHSPLRHYYVFRNTILMFKDVKLPLMWRLHSIWRLFQIAGFFFFFGPNRIKRIQLVKLGLIHGFNSIRGRLDEERLECESVSEKINTP